ncbi:hypothetical protein GOBAR_AA16434 [Gossypium barbadense]|uniref:Uncharacterized protein n=1 Tax=Gossypium barbadense TaxID=3634 RepID=A0A2P5XLJ0_GOSBA|nr:hypothetical protein GOBAR_AA16434 [Gossypium barbadense]
MARGMSSSDLWDQQQHASRCWCMSNRARARTGAQGGAAVCGAWCEQQGTIGLSMMVLAALVMQHLEYGDAKVDGGKGVWEVGLMVW